jgi:hypothetical protein
VDKLLEDERIVSAEPVFVWEKTATGTPIEVSEEEFERASHFKLLETEKVWKSIKNSNSPGKGAIVAVIDTGVDYNHKDLAANIWTNTGEIPNNGNDDDGNGYVDDIHGINAINYSGDPMDDHGHGTHVAGAIAMTAGNGGGIGLAYGAQIMCIKAGNAEGNFASTDIVRAVKYAVDNGADVINMSFGGVEKSSMVEAALNDAAEYAVLVASAGNGGLPTSEANGYKNCMDSYPAGYSCVIGVMASDNEDRLASFSNWDYLSGKGCEYEMTAPGTDIYSTLPDNRYAVWSGTSLSASMVSAAAAIIRSEYPNKSKYNAKYITGQLINATKSRAYAEPATVTVPVSTTSEVVTSVTTTITAVKSEDPLVNADVDGKKGITKDDFAYMLKGLVGINKLDGSMGDVNCDGAADMFDAVSILRLCNNPDFLKDIMDSTTISKEIINFDIPSVNIEEDGSCTKYTFTYNANLPFKAITGQLKFNGKPYSGEFDDIKLIESSSGEILYEFNNENGKFAAYCENNGTSGCFTISTYEGKDGSYAIDMNSLTFYDENGKEFRDFELMSFNPEFTKKTVEAQNFATAAAVGTPMAVAVYDKKVEYPRLNIMDSLTIQPRPDLRIMDIVKFDSTDISEANNGDGIIQPGETVGLGISIWNKWGTASDVNVKIEAVGADGKANPYVEVMDKTVSFGDISTFSGADNGFVRDSEGIKSVSKPIRIKVKDNAPNDGKMAFRITLTSKNGFETGDKAVYTTNSDYSFIVQHISYLNGIITKDTILDSSRYWITDGFSLANGVTLVVEPGTQIQIGTGETIYDYIVIQVHKGKFICKGTEKAPVMIFKSDDYEGSIRIDNNSWDSSETSTPVYNYTCFESLELNGGIFDHCRYYYCNDDSNRHEWLVRTEDMVTNSIFINADPTISISNAENCFFDNCSVGIRNHNHCTYSGEFVSKCIAWGSSFIDDKYNAIICENSTDVKMEYIGSSEIEKTYPFMTEAYITSEKGELVENAYIGYNYILHVKFNRKMETSIQPHIRISVESQVGSQYISYRILTGYWDSPMEWVGQIVLDDIFSEGIKYIYSEGAVAADDHWLVTGKDYGRFGFNVIKPSTIQTGDSETNKLKGSGDSGANQLTWLQDEMETLAGYNIYRSTDNKNFIKINNSLLSNEDLQYTDTDVVTGQKYYYYYRAVDTDFKESKPSNTVECIPLDKDKPQIVHTPVTYSESDKAITISANVTDNVKVDSVTLFYKYSDEQEWNSESMRNPSVSTYKKNFSSYEVRNGQLQYYIEATDGINKSFFGNEKEPCIIKIKPVSLTTTTTTSAITTTSTSSSVVTLTTTQRDIQSITTTASIHTEDKRIISNVYISPAKPNNELRIFAYINDGVRVDNITLYYKYNDKRTWNSINMENISDSTYKAIIPASYVTNGIIQYYIEAYDGNKIENYGKRKEPNNIDVQPVNTLTSSSMATTHTTTTTATSTTTTSTTTTTSSSTTTTHTTTSTLTTTAAPITLSVTALTLSNGEQYKIPVNSNGITFKSSNTDVAVVSSDGTVTAVGAGNVVISIIDLNYNVIQLKITVNANEIKQTDYELGDVNNSGIIDAVDASAVLKHYAKISTNQQGTFTKEQELAADVNFDGIIDSVDASKILAYYAYASTTIGELKPIKEYLKK